MNSTTFLMPDHEYSTPFYNQNHQAQPSTIQPIVLNLDYSQVSSPTSSFQQLDSSSPGWSSATSVVDSPCGPLVYDEFDLGHGDMNSIVDDRAYYGPVKYSYDCHANPSWATASCASDSFWMEEPPQILKSNDRFGPVVNPGTLEYGSFSSQASLGGLGLPSGTMLSPPGWSGDIKFHDVKATATSARRKKQAKKSMVKLPNGIDAVLEEKQRWICERSNDGTTCGKKFKRQEHLKRHWKAGCRATATDQEAPQCVLQLHCAGATCKQLAGQRTDNMVQHISTHLKRGRNKCVDADFLFYCLKRHEAESGMKVSKAAATMESAFDLLVKLPNAKLCPAETSLMEQHEWHQDYLRSRMLNRTDWSDRLEQLYRKKAWPGAVHCTYRKRTSKL